MELSINGEEIFLKSNDGESPMLQTLHLREYQNIGFNILYLSAGL